MSFLARASTVPGAGGDWTLALTDRLTGVGVTERLLGQTEYRVAEEPDEEWRGVTADVTDAYGERTHVTFRPERL
ncbi:MULTISPECIES: DUF6461 domain-containing protein [unclassified Streptomyces]|uniref:DUF6461 domain-containing protein n=1 Tax=unclassified Streptomyces TaxID=2593676 RepID=UPI0001C19409|nr:MULTISPECIES: DUF6461 domain-containing protein [unclassified Streptomyces]MYR69530.1 hypothetical protein [Streptomyces sp. SID4939]MYS01687.1 hypothetical protein [Streptomyces sp. SID4940]MYT66255.1 hypothetical protein [Streptomyces sp. SID8357]MYT83175.1 hypothetical protein [Streptomyces sp. SID8360]MYW36092.1 hypothetical protein [Streptomyces sp. SID1]